MATTAPAPSASRRAVDRTLHPSRRAGVVAFGLFGALPSLLWAAMEPSYLTDDFVVARTFEGGVLDGLYDVGFEQPARPLVGFYWLLVYELIGDHPVVHAVFLAVLNGALGVAAWLLARRLFRPEVAIAAALVVAFAPNRASSRLWFIVGSYVLVAVLALVAVWLLWCRERPWAAAAVVAGSALLYEGVVGLYAAALLMWWLQEPRRRFQIAVASGLPVGVVAAVMWAISPKGGEGPGPFDNVSTLPSGLVGEGLWGTSVAGTVGATALLGLASAALVTALLPSFRTSERWPRLVGAGLVIAVLSALPFAVGGAPFAVAGIFDRNLLFPTFGIAIVVGGGVALIAARSAAATIVSLVAIAGVFAVGNAQDVADYRDAADEGRHLEDQLVEDIDPSAYDAVLVGPALEGFRGVAAFIYPADLTIAMVAGHGDEWGSVSIPFTPETCAETAEALLARGEDVAYYDRLARTIDERDPVAACRRDGR